MWAHYSKDHTGFVVEFDIPIESFELPENDVEHFRTLVPYKVQYQDSKPIVNFIDDVGTKLTKQFLIKGKVWEYEQEERVIDYIRKSGIHEYDQQNILASAITGMRMKEPELTELEVALHKAVPVKGKFELFVPDRPDLRPVHWYW